MQIYGSSVVDTKIHLAPLLYCSVLVTRIIQRERPTANVRNSFLWNFPTQISEPRQALILAGNCHKSKYQDFSSIVLFGIDL